VEVYSHNGICLLLILLIVLSVLSLSLDYDNVCISTWLKCIVNKEYLVEKKYSLEKSLGKFLPEVKFIVKKYYWIILISSFIWAIATIVSQKSVEFSVDKFQISPSSA